MAVALPAIAAFIDARTPRPLTCALAFTSGRLTEGAPTAPPRALPTFSTFAFRKNKDMAFGSEERTATPNVLQRRVRRVSAPRRGAKTTTLRAAADTSSPAAAFLAHPRFASMSGAMVARSAAAPNVAIGQLGAKAAPAPAVVEDGPKMTVSRLMQKRPVAIVVHVMGTGLAMFLAGGTAGALAKTCTAPLVRNPQPGCSQPVFI